MLKVGIAGVGSISRLHITALQKFPELCQITAFADIFLQRAENEKAHFNLPNVNCYDSHKKMLENEQLDIVAVCTPPFSHAEITIGALDHGCHVIVEKPMASSLAECDAMLKAEKRSGKLLSVIAQNRFRDPIRNLKQVLQSGLAGKVRHAQVNSLWWRGSNYYDLWWRGRWDKEGGGCTLNHAVHHIDMLLWMMGMPEKVTAVLTNSGHGNAEVEDLSVAILQYPNGALAQITSSVVHHGEEQELIFQGEFARVSAPFKVCASKQLDNGFPAPNPELERKICEFADGIKPLKYEAHDAQILDVLTAINSGTAPAITGIDGRNTIEMITAVYKAGCLGHAVTLPIAKDDLFYTAEGILKSVPHFFEKKLSKESLTGDITVGSNYKTEL